MDKGQHLRLLIVEGTTNPTKSVIALATGLTFHLSATTEDSTTKDTTDTNGAWNEYDVTQRSGDIQMEALIGAAASGDPTDSGGKSLDDIMDLLNDSEVSWELAVVGSTNNRTVTKTICTGKGKIVSINPQGQNRQKATYSATMNISGPITVAND